MEIIIALIIILSIACVVLFAALIVLSSLFLQLICDSDDSAKTKSAHREDDNCCSWYGRWKVKKQKEKNMTGIVIGEIVDRVNDEQC
jgi:hypothetical protein